jgi:hypothetical protein
MYWSRQVRSFVAHCAYEDKTSPLAGEIRENLDNERWWEIHLRCECCGEIIRENAKHLEEVRELLSRQLRQYAFEKMSLDVHAGGADGNT